MQGQARRNKHYRPGNEYLSRMTLENKIAAANETVNQRFLMLVQTLSGIRALTSVTVNNPEEEDLLQRVLEVLKQNLDCEHCSIFILNNNEELHCIAGKSWSESENDISNSKKSSHIFNIGEGIIGYAARDRKIYYCKNCKEDKNSVSYTHLTLPTNREV